MGNTLVSPHFRFVSRLFGYLLCYGGWGLGFVSIYCKIPAECSVEDFWILGFCVGCNIWGFDVYMLEFGVSLFGYEGKMGTNNKINVIISLYTLSQVV